MKFNVGDKVRHVEHHVLGAGTIVSISGINVLIYWKGVKMEATFSIYRIMLDPFWKDFLDKVNDRMGALDKYMAWSHSVRMV